MKFMAGEDSKKPLIKTFLLVPFQSLLFFSGEPHVIFELPKGGLESKSWWSDLR